MTYSQNLWLFFTLLFGIRVVPGMDMIFVLANALTRGRSAGLAATGGIVAGGLVHSLYGAVGVGLLATLVPVLFKPLLIAGALYMAWIGVTLIRSAITVGGWRQPTPAPTGRPFGAASSPASSTQKHTCSCWPSIPSSCARILAPSHRRHW